MNIYELFQRKIKGSLHLLAIITLIMRGFYVLSFFLLIESNYSSKIMLAFSVAITFIFAFLILWYGLIPTIVAALYHSLDLILFVVWGYQGFTLQKTVLIVVLWLAVYGLWRNKNSKKSK